MLMQYIVIHLNLQPTVRKEFN